MKKKLPALLLLCVLCIFCINAYAEYDNYLAKWFIEIECDLDEYFCEVGEGRDFVDNSADVSYNGVTIGETLYAWRNAHCPTTDYANALKALIEEISDTDRIDDCYFDNLRAVLTDSELYAWGSSSRGAATCSEFYRVMLLTDGSDPYWIDVIVYLYWDEGYEHSDYAIYGNAPRQTMGAMEIQADYEQFVLNNASSFQWSESSGSSNGNASSKSGEYVGDMYVANCNEWVSLRSKADTSSRRLAKVPLGAKVSNVRFVTDKFAYCSYNGMTGYILTEYLSFSRVQNSGYSMYVANCNEWVSLRARPDTSSERLAKVPLGAKVSNIYYVTDEFVSCTYNGMKGYILAQYLSFEAAQSQSQSQSQYYGYNTSTRMGLAGKSLASNHDGIYLLEYGASSRLKDSNRTYPASNLFDGNYDNAWADGVSGEGVGESIYAVWTAGGMVHYTYGIAIRNGYQKTENIYYKNSRPKDITIWLNDIYYTAKLLDSRDGWQCVLFDSPVGFDCEIEITIRIDSVYSGTIYEDTCITEIDLLVGDYY